MGTQNGTIILTTTHMQVVVVNLAWCRRKCIAQTNLKNEGTMQEELPRGQLASLDIFLFLGIVFVRHCCTAYFKLVASLSPRLEPRAWTRMIEVSGSLYLIFRPRVGLCCEGACDCGSRNIQAAPTDFPADCRLHVWGCFLLP